MTLTVYVALDADCLQGCFANVYVRRILPVHKNAQSIVNLPPVPRYPPHPPRDSLKSHLQHNVLSPNHETFADTERTSAIRVPVLWSGIGVGGGGAERPLLLRC